MPPKERKRKRRALEAHLDGLSAEEREAILASIVGDSASESRRRDDETPAEKGEESDEDDDDDEEEVQPDRPRYPPDEIERRRRVLRTSWRFAAFSQFCAAFPHLTIKDFDIDLVEKDLEGSTEEDLYVAQVLARMLYTLTRDSRLAGTEPDKPWLFSLRREYLKRDPEHNPLGEEPEWLSEHDGHYRPPTADTSSEQKPKAATGDIKPDITATAASSVSGLQDATQAVDESVNDQTTAPTQTTSGNEPGQAKIEDVADEAERWPISKSWEELTLEEKIHALYCVGDWQLQNADKFRNFLTKNRIEEDHVVWRIEPIGTDAQHSKYWLFDDNRLWVERETPRKKEIRLIAEEAQRKTDKRREARERRILKEQRRRMHILHERRRERLEARRLEEERQRKELDAIDDQIRAEQASRGSTSSNKRKRGGQDDDDEEFGADDEAGTRSSSRISKARSNARVARPSRGRATRNGDVSGMDVDEDDWQKIPAEWLKSEDQERNEDPDFGADEAEDGGAEGGESDDALSELSILDDDDNDDELARQLSRRSSRKSPRKGANGKSLAEDEGDSELSALEDEGQYDVSDDEEEAEVEQDDGQRYPDSAWDLGPSYEELDAESPAGLVEWEAICTSLDDWAKFSRRFAGTTDVDEKALVSYVTSTVIPSVKATYEAREEERRRRLEAERAARQRARAQKAKRRAAQLKREQAANAAAQAALHKTRDTRVRSSRIASKKASGDDDYNPNAGNERLHYEFLPRTARDGSASGGDVKGVEADRRAARAKAREEQQRAREEADLLEALKASNPDAEHDQNGDQDADLADEAGDDAGDPAWDGSYTEAPQGGWEDYYLDCSVCKRRGMNLDITHKLVQCDTCDRWEHVACHRKADEKAGRRRDFDADPFQCEDCEGLGVQTKIIPKAAKKARTAKQLEGTKRGAEKRKAKTAQRRQEKEKENEDDGDTSQSYYEAPSSTAVQPVKTRTSSRRRSALEQPVEEVPSLDENGTQEPPAKAPAVLEDDVGSALPIEQALESKPAEADINVPTTTSDPQPEEVSTQDSNKDIAVVLDVHDAELPPQLSEAVASLADIA